MLHSNSINHASSADSADTNQSSKTMTAQDILKAARLRYAANSEYFIENLYVFEWESDILYKTKAGIYHELEIKVSKSDFKKKRKHEILRTGGCFGNYWNTNWKKMQRPNDFAYIVPSDLVEKVRELIPEYAGLYEVTDNNFISEVIKPPKLHDERISDADLDLCRKFYFNYREYKYKYESGAAKEIERLRYELSAVKEEFKAVTGFDFRDSL